MSEQQRWRVPWQWEFFRAHWEELRKVVEECGDAIRRLMDSVDQDTPPQHVHGPQHPLRAPRTYQGACTHTHTRPPHPVAVFRRRTP